MKIAVEREVLLAPLQVVNGAIEKKGLPVLAHVLMVGDGETVTFTGSDLETTLMAKASFPHEPFAVTLPAKRFLDVLSAFPKGVMVGVQVEGDKATIKAGRSRFQLVPLPAEDYPSFESLEFDIEQVLPQAVLRSMIEMTEHAMAKQDVRYYLNGMLLELRPERLTVAATDGHRLVVQHHPVSCDTDRQVILPSKAVAELKRLLQDTGDCTLSMSRNHVKVDLNERTFITKLIEGQFPDYQRVIPRITQETFEIRVNREALLAAVGRVALVLEKERGLALELTDNLLTLKAKNYQDEAEEQIEIEYLNGNGGVFAMGLNYSYVQDVLRAMESEQVKLSLTAADNPVLFGGVELDEGTFVIMTMRL